MDGRPRGSLPGQMFPHQNPSWPGQGGNGDTWYPGNMGPPGANHSPHHRALPAPLTFDNAYNFAGQQMTMQEFPTQHPYSNHESPLSHRSPALPAQSPGIVPVNGLGRPAPTPPFMLEPNYPGLNGQGIPYHVNVSADKNILMASPGLSHHQGNLQPGYPPRPMENTSRNSDSMCRVSSSSGYPGYDRTGHPMVKMEPGEATPLQSPHTQELENQHQQVSSTRHHSGAPVSETKELGPGMLRGRQGDLPSDSSILLQSSHQRPPDPSYHPPFNLPQEQPHFLAFSAAGVPVTSRAHDPQASEQNNKLLHPDPNNQLTRTPAAPREDKSNPTKPPPQAHPTFSSSTPAEALPPHHASEQVRRQQELSKTSQINMQKMAAVRNLSSSGDQQGRLHSLDSTLESSMLDSTMESSFNDSVNSPGRSKGPGKNDITKDAEGSSCRTPLEIYNEAYDDFNDKERSLVDAKIKDLKDFQPPCDCGPEAQENGPFYTHLGHAATGGDLRKLLETRLRVSGCALRMEKIRHTGIEGKTREDCPIAKWILRRGNLEEKFMCVWKERPGHMCEYSVTVTALICWDALSKQISGRAYDEISSKMATYGCETERQCRANKRKTCACQGPTDSDFHGASYTYGCSWSMFRDCCKFSRSTRELVRKFWTTNEEVEWDLEQSLEDVTDQVAAWHEMMAPDCFKNMTLFEEIAPDCRVGRNKGQRPYSGITAVVDFCAHSHKDTNNMVAGSTAIVSLTRPENRKLGKQKDEQFHVLPLYVPDMTQKEMDERVANGQLEVLKKFQRTLAIREKPMMCAKRGRPTMEKKKMLDGYVPDAYDPTAVFGKGEGASPGQRMSQSSRGAAGVKFESGDDGYLPENVNGFIAGDLPVYSYPVDDIIPQLDGTNESSKMGTSLTEEELKAEEDIYFEETDCSEAFMHPEIGGVALALPHGSLCLEVAKSEVHATTALKYPNKKHPCRIGLVFYQHKNLHFPEHGFKETQRRQYLKDVGDYKAWLDGTFVPTSRKVQQLQEYGFIFPENVKIVDRTQEARPEDYYKEGDYPGFKPNFPDDMLAYLADKFALSHDPNIPVQDEI